jgi:hypothetical protein
VLSYILSLTGCRMEAESPQRSEDLQRRAGTKAHSCTKADSPQFFKQQNTKQ